MSENELRRTVTRSTKACIVPPKDRNFVVEIMLDRRLHVPAHGQDHLRRSFVQPADGHLPAPRHRRQSGSPCCGPNQYVRVRVKGAMRPNAILVPQRAVQQGSKGHFVWVVDTDGKAEIRPVGPATGTATTGSSTQGLPPATRSWSTARSAAPDAPVKATPYEAPRAQRPARRRCSRRPSRAEKRRARRPRPRSSRRARAHVLQILHRTADLRDGRFAHHRDRRSGVDEGCCRSRSTRRSRRCRSR